MRALMLHFMLLSTARQCPLDTCQIRARSRSCNSCLQIYWVLCEFVAMQEFVKFIVGELCNYLDVLTMAAGR
jgi:hypothetical protein